MGCALDFIESPATLTRRKSIQMRTGTSHLCTVPADLGKVMRLDIRNGKVIAETESGIQMIVPVPKD